ncbi:hypothetical protein M2650_15120 [Luteimonas sp. SX5]|uniref:N-acetyltransferase domain-containing protein n=1 Tax=Luteimonas galliterrae TaxID=2940486 RepID=A0ABT0MMW1_9GAMM|nr:hypothetical protein [Luteimonas galliterrae]MCL1635953.1 hypothetical protein [Luteimonas galliterrae]
MNAEARALSRLPALTIRSVIHDDLPQLLRLCAEHAEQTAFERLPYGRIRHDPLELREALFEPPLRAWAWLLHAGDEAIGYAAATVGFSMLERGYYLQLEPWHVRAPWRTDGADLLLLQQAQYLALKLGCLNLQWQAPAWSAASALSSERATRIETVRHVLPLAPRATADDASGLLHA